ncbi:pathogen-related protein-like [Chenopodium quinoa]|uniref:Pathogen-related protein n=1 Tax=Chenopodium quinoa TaxID=63459 RepID=A0A803MYX9_CHEQI|nr:pathogen-related protein-like [Chenopodium quinoa]
MEDEQKEIAIKVAGDKYRIILHEEIESKDIQWRHGGPPIFDKVNKLFEEGRTKVWPKGSLEETVQNAIKTWEMELSHKTRLQDFKSICPEKFRLFVNGREGLTREEVLRLGSYNSLLKSSMPEEFQTYYKASEETFESSHDAFQAAFPRGFAWEVISVYSGPPVIAYKFRHWGYFEGPYKGHAPTGEMLQFYGLGILKVDESMKAEDVEIYFDPVELFAGLLKGQPLYDQLATTSHHDTVGICRGNDNSHNTH